MDENLTKQLQTRLEELPEDVQKAIQSADLETKIQDVAKKFQLHIDQTEILGDETRLIMLGFVDPSEFADQISTRLNLSKEQAESVAQEISTQIFLPIRESMRAFMEERALQAQLLDESKSNQQKPSDKNDLSVVMPSAANVTAPAVPKSPAAPTPAVTIPPKPPTPAATTPPSAIKPVEIHAADLMLSEPTISMPPKAPVPPAPAPASPSISTPASPVPASATKVETQKPAPYKADPYREPPE